MTLSPRLLALVEALPLHPDSRVLEIGCGTGAAARAIADGLVDGHVLAIDRSATALATTAGARLFIDGGDLLRELPIPRR